MRPFWQVGWDMFNTLIAGLGWLGGWITKGWWTAWKNRGG